MCAICNVTGIPVCTGSCGMNLHETLSATAIIGAAGVGTFRLWAGGIINRIKKLSKNEET
jgi:hypothetical protein